MIDLSLGSLLAYAVLLLVGVLIGLALSRNSKKANEAFDRLRMEYDEKLLAAREEIARLRAKTK